MDWAHAPSEPRFPEPMNGPVLVTGGMGFVGSRLCAALAEAHTEVVALDDLSVGRMPKSGLDGVILEVVDIRDESAVLATISKHAPRVVYHLAAMHYIPACEADPAKCLAINLAGTEIVLRAAAATNSVRTVVLASSAAVYSPSGDPHDESSAVGPLELYGLTKLWSEQMAQLFHAQTGIPVGIARIFNVFGPRETNPHLIPAVLLQALEGEVLHLGNLTTARDYVFVDDVARGMVLLAEHAPDHGLLVCNLGTESDHRGTDIVRLAESILGKKLRIEQDASKMRQSDRPRLRSNSTRARSLLGWSPRMSLEDGLRAALKDPAAYADAASFTRRSPSD